MDYPIESVTARAFKVPTDAPESDGTLAWEATTLVLAEVAAGGSRGIGYSYTHAGAAGVIRDELRPVILGHDVLAIPAAWAAMHRAVRNVGSRGIAAASIAAVDIALWDLKAKIVGLPLVGLLGAVRPAVPVYGSGGFTSYSVQRLCQQLAGWVEQGILQVKMKVGREPEEDVSRVSAARQAIGSAAALFVDANGAYDRKQALAMAMAFGERGVTWFEEPVSSDDLRGLRMLRDRAPPPMEIAAGEYGYEPVYFRRMLEAGAVDVLQADATRCGGISGFLSVAAVCDSFGVPLSAHTAPAIHLHPCCAAVRVRHIEYFHDHTRIEQMLFDGAPAPSGGQLAPDLSRPGLGLEFKESDGERYEVHSP